MLSRRSLIPMMGLLPERPRLLGHPFEVNGSRSLA